MTVTSAEPCNCPDSLALQAENAALKKENRQLKLSLRFGRERLRELLAKVNTVLDGMPVEADEAAAPSAHHDAVVAAGYQRVVEIAEGSPLRAHEQRLSPEAWRRLIGRMGELVAAEQAKADG